MWRGFADLAAGFGVGTTTAWRYVNEAELLAARAPDLRKAGVCRSVAFGSRVSDHATND
jgi:hypothetical protein